MYTKLTQVGTDAQLLFHYHVMVKYVPDMCTNVTSKSLMPSTLASSLDTFEMH